MTKRTGILLHITSLPGKYGIGDFGKCAFDFIDYLKRHEMNVWQILPINDLNETFSPYQPISMYAGNVLLIDLDYLKEEKLIEEIPKYSGSTNKVDYIEVKRFKIGILKNAYSVFKMNKSKAYNKFCEEESDWLNDYSLYCSLKDYYKDKRVREFTNMQKNYAEAYWNTWDYDIQNRENIDFWIEKLKDNIEYYKFLQFIFYKQWQRLKDYANLNNIEIFGDVPIYAAFDSVDVWKNQELFMLDKNKPVLVAGGPPDHYNAKGQVWGNCIYNWDVHYSDNFAWWKKNYQFKMRKFDILRIDHFRGFCKFWGIPYEAEDASDGKWYEGPGERFFESILEITNDFEIIVEDLGIITDEVIKVKDKFGFAGIKIIQDFILNNNIEDNLEYNCVLYTGTHDNSTILGWYNNLISSEKSYLDKLILHANVKNINDFILKVVISSKAKIVIINFQDLIGLDDSYRMNRPGTNIGNWDFITNVDMFNDEIIESSHMLIKEYRK